MEIINGSPYQDITTSSLTLTTNPGEGKTLVSDANGNLSFINHNYAGHGAPGVTNDLTEGYSASSTWVDIDESPAPMYKCLSAALGAAVWQVTSIDPSDFGSIASQDSNNVNITGGTLTGVALGNSTISTLNELTLAKLSTGFSVAGGTTSKSLTVSGDATINQSVATTSSPTFATINELSFIKLLAGFSISGGTVSKTLTVLEDASISGDNTGDQNLAGYALTTYVDDGLSNKAAATHTHSNATTSVAGFESAADKTKLDSVTFGADVTNVTSIGNAIAGATLKATPLDADKFGYSDSAATNVIKYFTWANLKASIKTYCDTLYNNYVHPNHSGDVTSVADGATTIVSKAVTLAKMADMATASLLGRNTASTGVPEVLSTATVKTMLGVGTIANRSLTISTSDPSGGVSGDVWFKYTP